MRKDQGACTKGANSVEFATVIIKKFSVHLPIDSK